MSTQRRLNTVRLWSLLGFLPFVAVLVYPPWQETPTWGLDVRRNFIWTESDLLYQRIALGQWAVELGATLAIAIAIIAVVFNVTPKWKEKSSSAETGSDPPKEN